MKLYRFLTGPDDASFCHRVSAELDKGWELYAGPTYTFEPGLDGAAGALRCGQAVVKTIEGSTYDPGMKLGEQ